MGINGAAISTQSMPAHPKKEPSDDRSPVSRDRLQSAITEAVRKPLALTLSRYLVEMGCSTAPACFSAFRLPQPFHRELDSRMKWPFAIPGAVVTGVTCLSGHIQRKIPADGDHPAGFRSRIVPSEERHCGILSAIPRIDMAWNDLRLVLVNVDFMATPCWMDVQPAAYTGLNGEASPDQRGWRRSARKRNRQRHRCAREAARA
jgi:hypothetical protein